VEALRKELLQNTTAVEINDFGARATVENSSRYKKSINKIAQASLKRPKYAQLIFRLVNHFQPSCILELGTSLGVTTSYMSVANPKAKIITIEGAEAIAAVAKNNFEKLKLKNIEQVLGNFDQVLTGQVEKFAVLDFVFFDGNHRKSATLNYFKECLKHKNTQSVFIFDDIYWSTEMKEAWEEIKNNEEVTLTIDLFEMGIVFFRTEQAKQHFVIRF
jgi:predicted O-methyltransferase YrrM